MIQNTTGCSLTIYANAVINNSKTVMNCGIIVVVMGTILSIIGNFLVLLKSIIAKTLSIVGQRLTVVQFITSHFYSVSISAIVLIAAAD